MNRPLTLVSVLSCALLISACSDDSKTQEAAPAPAAVPPPPAPVEAPAPAAAPAPTAEEPKEGPSEDVYRTQAEALVAAIDGGKTAEDILKLSEELTATGLSMIPGLIAAHPECKEYLDAIVAVGATLKDLPIEEIESGYHMDGKLPKMPSADCYHGKDLVVHPATVSALAKAGLATDEAREAAKGEIVEVLGHLTAIEPKKAE